MERYFVELSYDGTNFFGWQRQPRQSSVQQTIENAFTQLYSNHPISIVGCGRTDTGVHAHSYVFHVDLPSIPPTLEQFILRLNRILPPSICIHSMESVTAQKHARFDAKWRTYRYFIHTSKNPFKQMHSLYVPQKLDFIAMNEAANYLVGTKDFTSFSKTHTDVKTHICQVTEANWVKISDEDYYFELTANRFLRNMVRSTVATLLAVGTGKLSVLEFNEVLLAQDRNKAIGSVDAKGLFLWKIEY